MSSSLTPHKRNFLGLLFGAVIVVLVFLGLLNEHTPPQEPAGLEVGQPFPRLRAEGWLNGEPPTAESLQGQVLVVDAWASWCGPCRAKAPELIELHRKFSPQGAVFIGLTTDTHEDLPSAQAFLSDTGINWLNGYGAIETLTDLKAEYIPMLWVVSRDGRIAWNQNSPQSLEEAIAAELKKPVPSASPATSDPAAASAASDSDSSPIKP